MSYPPKSLGNESPTGSSDDLQNPEMHGKDEKRSSYLSDADSVHITKGSHLLPLLILPSEFYADQDPHVWLPKKYMASSWLPLFYDLIVVAVLSIFSQAHELSSAHAIGSFAAFFVIMWYVYVAQIMYDSRYQTDDWYHRFMKLLQLCIFMLLGAMSGNWDPTEIQQVTDYNAPDAPLRYSAKISFLSVIWAIALSRLILGVQYLVIIHLARKAKRPTRSMLYSLGGIVGAAILLILSASLHASSPQMVAAKLVLLYSAIAIELLGQFLAASTKYYIQPEAELLSERLGSFTLIILGEGFISQLRTFNNAMSGFSIADKGIYVTVFAAMVLLFLVWVFLFSGFGPTRWKGEHRSMVYTIMHFPLHFVILLLLAALVNASNSRAFSRGVLSMADDIGDIMVGIQNSTTRSSPAFDRTRHDLTLQLGKLFLQPSFPDQYQIMLNSVNTSDANTTSWNITLQGIQYVAQVSIQAATLYNIEIEDTLINEYVQLTSITVPGPINDVIIANIRHGVEIFENIISELLTASVIGTLWLFPAAGGVLLLAAVLAFIRKDYQGPDTLATEILLFVAGVICCLLTLLDLGNHRIEWHFAGDDKETAPMITLLLKNWPVGIVALVYTVTWMSEQAVLWWQNRKHWRKDVVITAEHQD